MKPQRRSLIVMILSGAVGIGLVWGVRAQEGEPPRPPKNGDAVQVLLDDGRLIEGTLVSQSRDDVTVSIAGIDATYPRGEVAAVRLAPTPEERYRQRREKLDDADVDGRIQLAKDMLQIGAADLAKRELQSLVQENRSTGEVEALIAAADAQAQMRDANGGATEEPATPTGPRNPRPQPGEEPTEEERLPRLSDEQIRTLKVYELTFGQGGPRVQVPSTTVKKFIEQYRNEPGVPRTLDEERAFRRLPGERQLQFMFTAKARDLYPEVQVYGDPIPIRDFRSNLHRTYVLNYCATSQCHGGQNNDASNAFHLIRGPASADSTLYTNFYWLQSYQNGQGYMIDRDQGRRSLLLQYGLPQNVAGALAHPPVEGMRPFINSEQDPRFEQYVRTIDALFASGGPQNYGIDFATQQGAAATQPAEGENPAEADPAADPAAPTDPAPPADAPGDPTGQGMGG